ncbi:MAG: citrate lyase subunit alpha [Oscillospiraceae bacterium]
MSKLVETLKDVIKKCNIKDGMTVSFHHHLRNGDFVVNLVLDEISKLGIKNLHLNASSLFNTHAPIIEHIKNGVITNITTNYMGSVIGKEISKGIMNNPVTFRTHGGRPRAIENFEDKIDIAFIAAPSSDCMGNANGLYGPSACGSMGYCVSDSKFSNKTVVITDNLLDYPLHPSPIEETNVDYVVVIDKIGDPSGIVSGTTQITKDPVGLHIAEKASKIIELSGLLKNGFSFQTGAGGASLAVTKFLKTTMHNQNIKGSFALGGITRYLVEMMKEGLFDNLLDVQCFDLEAVNSIKTNSNHIEISASRYANKWCKSCAVDSLDVVILGATQIDLDFNVNVHTDSNGYIMGGSGGHSDTAEGAKLTIIVAPLYRARLPLIVEKVICKTTKGDVVDVLVTQKGIAINPKRQDLIEVLKKNSDLNIVDIKDLLKLCNEVVGIPSPINFGDRIVANVTYRDGTLVDTIKNIN